MRLVKTRITRHGEDNTYDCLEELVQIDLSLTLRVLFEDRGNDDGAFL